MADRIDEAGESWIDEGHEKGWMMPVKRWFQRWPIVRHFWVGWVGIQVERHNTRWRQMGSIPTGYDEWVLYGVWRGFDNAILSARQKGGA